MSAFNWNPGGCCCVVFSDIMAFGVDNIDNPTKTRIPRTCSVTYQGVQWRNQFGQQVQPPPCSIATYLENFTHHLKAWAPYYAFNKPPAPSEPQQQMCWTTAKEQWIIRPAWPGLVAGNPDFKKGRLPWRQVTTTGNTLVNQSDPDPPYPFDSGAGVFGSEQNFHRLSSNVIGQPDFGYPYFDPAPSFMFNGNCTPDDDIGNVAELVIQVGGPATPQVPAGQIGAIFGSRFGGVTDTFGAQVPTWIKPIGQTVQKTFNLSGGVNRTQWICVIPETISFSSTSYAFGGSPNKQFAQNRFGYLGEMTVTVTFGDWFDGPIANAP